MVFRKSLVISEYLYSLPTSYSANIILRFSNDYVIYKKWSFKKDYRQASIYQLDFRVDFGWNKKETALPFTSYISKSLHYTQQDLYRFFFSKHVLRFYIFPLQTVFFNHTCIFSSSTHLQSKYFRNSISNYS